MTMLRISDSDNLELSKVLFFEKKIAKNIYKFNKNKDKTDKERSIKILNITLYIIL